MDMYDNRGGTIAFTNPVLTRTGAETVHDTTVTLAFSIGGKSYTKTAITDGVTPTADAFSGDTFAAIPAGYSCLFVWGFDASGNAKVCQGPLVLTADLTAEAAALHFPNLPDTMCPCGYHSVKHANATAFQFGTSNWNATGVTLGAVIPCSRLPTQPLTALT